MGKPVRRAAPTHKQHSRRKPFWLRETWSRDFEVAAPRTLLYRTPSPADVICVDPDGPVAEW